MWEKKVTIARYKHTIQKKNSELSVIFDYMTPEISKLILIQKKNKDQGKFQVIPWF